MALLGNFIKHSKICNFCDFTKISNAGSITNYPFVMSVRTSKHYNPKFKWLRSKKFKTIELPDKEKIMEEKIEILHRLKIYPRYWKPRPMTFTTISDVVDPYTPPEGDGSYTPVSKSFQKLSDTSKTKLSELTAIRKIRNYDLSFKKSLFLQDAHDIYVKAHTVLMKKDTEELSNYVTEKANQEMMMGLNNKTLRWKFIESLEPPSLVQSRVQDVIFEKNCFAQLTVRFHTKQSLAIYDRFGRLIYGNEMLAKDVLEYVVFEKHINNEYGKWRLHAKIIPDWKEPSSAPARTHRVVDVVEDDEIPDDVPEEPHGTSEIQTVTSAQ